MTNTADACFFIEPACASISREHAISTPCTVYNDGELTVELYFNLIKVQ